MTQDWIRETLAARAADLGLTAYTVGKATGIDVGTVRRYFTGRCALNSRYVSAIASHLGMTMTTSEVTPAEMRRRVVEAGTKPRPCSDTN